MLMNSENIELKRNQYRIFAVGISLFLMIFFWEIAMFHGPFEMVALIPLALGTFLINSSFVLPLISKRICYYHVIFLWTFIVFGPAVASLTAALVLSAGLLKTAFRYKSHLSEKLLEFVPSLLAIWIVGLMFAFIPPLGELSNYGSLLPHIFVVTFYYLLYSAVSVTGNWMFRSINLIGEWRKVYLVPTLVLLSIAFGAGLLNHFAVSGGAKIYLLAVPFSLFALTTFKIYTENLSESSRRLAEHSQLQMSIIETLALAIDAKDHSTHGHARRVQVYAVGLARTLGIDNEDDLEALSTAALLHDIGKLAIPEYILSKPGKLSDAEFAKMMRHVEIGANILEPIHFPYPVVPIIRYHHERHNGTGYPVGLKGDEIPLGSKILSVADTFDALTAQRTYRTQLTIAEAINLLKCEAGTSFDPEIIKAFLRTANSLVEEVAALDINKYTNNTHLTQDAPESPQEHKLWLRKKSFTEIASTHREIYALHEIFQTVGKSLNLQDTLRIICSKLQSVVPFNTCVVYLKNKKTELIYPEMITGDFAEQVKKNWIKFGEGLTGYSIAFNQPVVNTDPSHDFSNLTYLEKPHQLANALIFPLNAKGNVLGAIALYSTDREKGIFSEDHVRLMEMVSDRAAVAIQNAQSFEYYEENSLTDPLTGLPNSRFMFMAFEQNLKKAERTKEKMAILVMDLNEFKQINDQYGHKVGDEVLVKVGEILQKEMRKYDTCIRYAGDEFVAFLYNADREIAEKIVSRIRKSVQALVIKVRSGKEVHLGISVGLSMYPDDGSELTQLFTVADSQMYNDKFESKAETARYTENSLKDAVALDEDIEFQRAN